MNFKFRATVFAGLLASAAPAQTTYTWTGAGATNQWSAGNPGGPFNWTPTGLPPTASIVAFVNPTPYPTVDLQVSRTVNSIQFGGTTGYSLNNGSLILSTGNLTVTGTSASPVRHAINVPVALGTAGTWSIGPSSLDMVGAITDGGSEFSLTKTGTGTLTLYAANTYTGGTVVNGGTLALGFNNAMPTGGNVTVNSGATFDIDTHSNTAATALSTLALNGGAFHITSGSSNYFVNSISLTGGAVNGPNLSTFNLNLIGSQGIVSNASAATSTIVLSLGGSAIPRILNTSGAPTAINVAAGTTASGIDLDVTALFSRAGNNTEFDKTGAGTMRLNLPTSGTNRSTADFVVQAGRLRIDDPTALGSGRFALNSGTFTYGGATGTLATPINMDGYGTVEVTQAGTTLTASASITGAGGLTITGPGALALTGASTYAGPTIVNGTLQVGAGGSLTNSSVTINAGGTLTISGGSVTPGANNFIALVGGIAPATVNLTSGTLSVIETVVGSAGANNVFTQSGGAHTTSGNFYVGVNTSTGGMYNLSSTGQLSTAKTYVGYYGTGTFNQSGGTHTIAASLDIGSYANASGTYNLSGGTLVAAMVQGGAGTSFFNFNGGTLQAGADASAFVTKLTTAAVQGGGAIVDSNGHSITVGQALVHDPAPGAPALDGGLQKLGTGTLTLTGANTYTGPTTINAGTLQVGAGGTVGVLGAGAITNNGALAFNRSDAVTLASAISGAGGLTQSGAGTLTLTGPSTYTGRTTINAGVLKIGTGGSLTNSFVAVNAGGAFTIAGGSVTAGSAVIFSVAGGTTISATANLFSGTLSTGESDVGNAGIGAFNQTGGTHIVNGNMFLGLAGGNGTYTLGAGTVSAINLVAGFTGSGAFSQTGGANTVGTLYAAYDSGTTGSYTLSGTGQLITATTVIASSGSGTFTQTGGSHTVGVGGQLYIGLYGGGNGIYTLSGAGQLSTPSTDVGDYGTGAFVQTGGTHSIGGGLDIAYFSTGVGSYAMSGGLLTTTSTTVGSDGAGTFVQTGGAHIISGPLTLAVRSDGSGTYTLSGGTLQTNIVNGTGASTFNFDGGTLKAGANSPTFIAGLTTAVVQAGGAVIDSNGYAITISQQLLHDASLGIPQDGGLTKKGSGTLVLTGANTYTGGTMIVGGTLSVASDGSLGAPAGAVSVLNAGQLVFSGSATTSRELNLNVSSLAAPAGGIITFSGATVTGGFLRGPGTFVVTGGTTLSGSTTFGSTVINQTGAGSYSNFSNGGSLTVAASVVATISMNGFTNQGSGSLTVGAASAVNVADFQSYGLLTFDPATVGSGQLTLMTNLGLSPLYFNGGSRTFIGTPATAGPPSAPNFVAGIDLHGQNAVVAGGLFVNNGFVADGSAAGTATVIADFGSLVKGAGFFQNPVVTQNGGRFQAGNSPGSAAFGKFVLGPGGVSSYVFAIDDATGTAGPSPDALGHVSGWGLVNAVRQQIGTTMTAGDFTWTATPADKVTVALDTLVNPTTVGIDIAGPMADFDPTKSYVWPAVQWAGAYSGPTDAATLNADTAFDMSGFANPVAGTFGWALGGSSLSLSYTPTPVPEPGTLALVGLAVVGLAGWRRRSTSTAPCPTIF